MSVTFYMKCNIRCLIITFEFNNVPCLRFKIVKIVKVLLLHGGRSHSMNNDVAQVCNKPNVYMFHFTFKPVMHTNCIIYPLNMIVL